MEGTTAGNKQRTYQEILTAATAASVALFAIDLLILLNVSWCACSLIVLCPILIISALTAAACQHIRSLQPCDSLSSRGFLINSAMKLFQITVARYRLAKMKKAFRSRSAMRAMQEAALMQLVKQSRDTVFGRDHRFSEIQGIEDYRALVPVRDYADLDKYNQMAYRGEPNVLFSGPVNYLAKTSGTTGKNKTFPVSDRYRLTLLLNFFVTFRCTDEFMAKIGRRDRVAKQLFLAVNPEDKKNEFGIPIGPVSKYFFSRGDLYTTPDESYLRVHDPKAGYYIHAVFALWHERVGIVHVFFPTNLITFLRCLASNWDSVLGDIETGRLSADKVGADADLLNHLNGRLSPKPARAAQLRALFGDGQDLSGFFEKAWPDVPCVMLARSGSFQASYRYLKKYLMNVPAFCSLIMGTEGLAGMNLSIVGEDEPDRYHPYLSGSFFEFVQVDEFGTSLGEPRLAHELQLGCLYETVATSYNCFRLRVGDVIKVVAMDGCAPVFEISHRKSHVLSVHVEKTNEKSLQACVMLAAQRLGCQLVDFTAADCFLYEPVAGVSLGTKYYALFVELDGDRRLKEDEKPAFDAALQESCENYKQFRGEGHIDAMRVLQVRSGAFASLKQEMIRQNRDISESQFKMPRVLKNDGQVRCLMENLTP